MGRIATIIGTRPEIVKMAPVVEALDGLRHEHVLVHSGQHYDLLMDAVFFRDMELRKPDFQFELKAKPPHLQVATTMRQIAPAVADADLVVVHGDTNTTLAGALLGNKLGIPVAHVEAGIRSFDRSMPEEVNRVLTDQVSNLLFAPTRIASENLRAEGVRSGVHVVGNSVIDAIQQNLERAKGASRVVERLGLTPGRYAVITFHRAENVDQRPRFERVLKVLTEVAHRYTLEIVFPVHPRTRKMAKAFGLERMLNASRVLRGIDPLGYLDMLVLEKAAALVLTDSGGLQEESCYFRVPCLTLRENTERPETLEIGANVLVGTDPGRILSAVKRQLAASRDWPNPYGDGTTAARIARIIKEFLD